MGLIGRRNERGLRLTLRVVAPSHEVPLLVLEEVHRCTLRLEGNNDTTLLGGGLRLIREAHAVAEIVQHKVRWALIRIPVHILILGIIEILDILVRGPLVVPKLKGILATQQSNLIALHKTSGPGRPLGVGIIEADVRILSKGFALVQIRDLLHRIDRAPTYLVSSEDLIPFSIILNALDNLIEARDIFVLVLLIHRLQSVEGKVPHDLQVLRNQDAKPGIGGEGHVIFPKQLLDLLMVINIDRTKVAVLLQLLIQRIVEAHVVDDHPLLLKSRVLIRQGHNLGVTRGEIFIIVATANILTRHVDVPQLLLRQLEARRRLRLIDIALRCVQRMQGQGQSPRQHRSRQHHRRAALHKVEPLSFSF